MAVSGKVLVGNNSDSVWNYGGKQIGVGGPIECPMGPWGRPADCLFSLSRLASKGIITGSQSNQWLVSGAGAPGFPVESPGNP